MRSTGMNKEDRRQIRTRRTEVLSWRIRGSQQEPRAAWLLESSEDGLAFVWRGDQPPAPDAVIELQINPGADHAAGWEPCVVRNLRQVHDNLCVIGAEMLRYREFPPSPAKLRGPRSPKSTGESLAEPKSLAPTSLPPADSIVTVRELIDAPMQEAIDQATSPTPLPPGVI